MGKNAIDYKTKLYPYWLSNFGSPAIGKKHGSLKDVVRNIRYVYKICGHNHKHIGIGSDFAGGITPPKEMKCHGEIGKLHKLLLREFDNDRKIVEDILANNVINFLKTNWKSGLPDHAEKSHIQ